MPYLLNLHKVFCIPIIYDHVGQNQIPRWKPCHWHLPRGLLTHSHIVWKSLAPVRFVGPKAQQQEFIATVASGASCRNMNPPILRKTKHVTEYMGRALQFLKKLRPKTHSLNWPPFSIFQNATSLSPKSPARRRSGCLIASAPVVYPWLREAQTLPAPQNP